jgi:hypothetical protein
VCFPRKRPNSPYWKFLAFYPYLWENIQPPILEVPYILPKVLPLPQESALALCLRQVPVTPTQPLGCPDHQSSTRLSYLGTCMEFNLVLCAACLGWPLFLCCQLTFDLEFIVVMVDFPSPEATATWWQDVSPLRRGSPWLSG